MRGNEDVPPAGRSVRESEIFREPPGSGNYTSSIGAAVGIELFQGRDLARRARSSKTIVEPEREVPVLAETDVLVVGGGPAGTAAAIAAARLGADVLLVERYNHLGGLSTGGLVIWIDRMTDWFGRYIIIQRELLRQGAYLSPAVACADKSESFVSTVGVLLSKLHPMRMRLPA